MGTLKYDEDDYKQALAHLKTAEFELDSAFKVFTAYYQKLDYRLFTGSLNAKPYVDAIINGNKDIQRNQERSKKYINYIQKIINTYETANYRIMDEVNKLMDKLWNQNAIKNISNENQVNISNLNYIGASSQTQFIGANNIKFKEIKSEPKTETPKKKKNIFQRGWSKVKGIGNDIKDTACDFGNWMLYEPVGEKWDDIKDTGERMLATGCNASTSFTNGLFSSVEGIVDGSFKLFTDLNVMPVAYLADGINFVGCKITGSEYNSIVEDINNLRGKFINYNATEKIMNSSVFTNEEYEDYIDKNSYSPDTVSTISDMFGKFITLAGVTVATGGNSLIPGVTTTYLNSDGINTQKALTEGASYNDAALYGKLSGIKDAAAYYAAGKIFNNIKIGNGESFLSIYGTKGVQVSLDTADGMSASIVDSGIQKVTYKKDKTLKEIYAENGGIERTLQDGAMAFGFSALTTQTGSSKNKVESVDNPTVKDVEIKVQETRTIPDLDAQITKANYETEKGHFVSIDIDNIDSISPEQFAKLNKTFGVMFKLKDGSTILAEEIKQYQLTKNIADVNMKPTTEKINNQSNTSSVKPKKIKKSEIMKKTVENKNNLVEGIVNEIPKKLDDVSKIRAVYLKLNQATTYSDQFFAIDDTMKRLKNEGLDSKIPDDFNIKRTEIINKTIDINNISGNEQIVCTNWANMYKELLEQVGIDKSKIRIFGKEGAHKYVVVDIGKGKSIVADGTENFGGGTDLGNSKFGLETTGFKIMKTSDIGNDISINAKKLQKIYQQNQNAISETKSIISKIDDKIGYNSSQYKKDFEEVTDMYKNMTSNLSVDEKVQNIKKILDNNQSAIEQFSILDNNKFKMFGMNDVTSNLYIKDEDIIAVINYRDNGINKHLVKINNQPIEVYEDISEIIEGATKRV